MAHSSSLIIANWKMNLRNSEVMAYLEAFLPLAEKNAFTHDVVLCPSFVSLPSAQWRLSQSKATHVSLGAQDLFWEEKGAFTGEVSASMVKECASHVLIGHSERRMYRNETNEQIAKKMKVALAHELTPMLCIGESLETYEVKESQAFLEQQLRESLKGVTYWPDQPIIIAYEPIWALSSTAKRHDADPSYIQETAAFIRQIVGQLYNEGSAREARILYGGNVQPNQVASYTSLDDINGVLVGSASTTPDTFFEIISHIK